MIYLYQTQTGIEPHTDKEFAENVLNIGEPIAELTEQEWNDAGGLARMIDGGLFLGKTQAEKDDEQAREVRAKRDRIIAKEDWRYTRYNSEVRQGLTPSDDIVALDAYIQALRDIPDQAGFPWNVEWPTLGGV
jgi:hypothetical protein